MKKFISIISSMAITATMAAAFSANAAGEEVTFSEPSFYFKAQENESYEVLKFGGIFVNRKVNDGASIAAEVYIKDESKVAGQVFLKWASDKENLKLTNVTGPVAKYGATPYKNYKSDDDIAIVTLDAINGVGLNYSDISSPKPMEYTKEKSDEYPLACFDATFAKDAPGGTYNVFVYDDNPYFSSVVCRPTGDGRGVEVFPAEKSPSLMINTSDRMLGDVNDDTRVDAVDVSGIMKAYTNLSSSKDSGFTDDQMACADVNGDGMVDAVDASNILAYYAYASSNSSAEILSLNNFVKSRK